jgi:hypothetical protein
MGSNPIGLTTESPVKLGLFAFLPGTNGGGFGWNKAGLAGSKVHRECTEKIGRARSQERAEYDDFVARRHASAACDPDTSGTIRRPNSARSRPGPSRRDAGDRSAPAPVRISQCSRGTGHNFHPPKNGHPAFTRMAQILRADPAATRLEETLARLPDEWTLLPDRRIGGGSGPLVALALIHPEIGIALIDFIPGRAAAALAPLEGLLAGERIIGDGERLPAVAITITDEEIERVGEKLADAFETAPPCNMADTSWSQRVIELLLHGAHATMAPLLPMCWPEPPTQAEPAPTDDDAFAPPLATRTRASGWLAIAYATAFALMAVGGAAAFILAEPAKLAPTAALDLPPPIARVDALPPLSSATAPDQAWEPSPPRLPAQAPPSSPPPSHRRQRSHDRSSRRNPTARPFPRSRRRHARSRRPVASLPPRTKPGCRPRRDPCRSSDEPPTGNSKSSPRLQKGIASSRDARAMQAHDRLPARKAARL